MKMRLESIGNEKELKAHVDALRSEVEVMRDAQLHTNAAHDAQRACHVRPAAPDAPGASEKEFKARDAWRMRA
jgi:hypothetical protein